MDTTGRPDGKRVVVTGATGNVGTSVVRALAGDPGIGSVLGLARRRPSLEIAGVEWDTVDLSRDDSEERLTGLLRGADAVVHLAWRFQPTHDPVITWRSNVLGSQRVFRAVERSEVPALVHASSVGAYSPGPKDEPGVNEEWPTHGWPDAAYCREKAYLERVLDTFELRHPQIRVVRMRPGFLFQETAAPEQRRIFAGRHVPGSLLRPDLLPFVPDLEGLRFQVLHTDDAAEAYRLAVLNDVRGPFNLAADPVVDARKLADLLDARVVRIPRALVRTALAGAWRAHAVPASPHLFDAVLRLPVLDSTRAHEVLGWQPTRTADQALNAFLRGVREGRGEDTAPLAGRKVG
ncbi:NAD-dependent epimerase/dehydratase family protein [Streptomyces microflavus]|uniref:NAD-dependent epimerase n=1 Tax=Streptomyces microflavus TaxID=1919 RepID=A0A7J0CIW7_STRMI|nr:MULTISPECIES: NAD-dependent epimerase/dehydratase family protein [Streptomyces]MDX2977690.1 NAD-dependent epimerase/dehydratase family protein [Streptomyces sp. NRRL_B-2249]GFN01854.1 NAD-dependent epimerase [Streptomyces microflavus]GGX76698.1 NAD-dependent epimerase [Streptomyces microflavus]